MEAVDYYTPPSKTGNTVRTVFDVILLGGCLYGTNRLLQRAKTKPDSFIGKNYLKADKFLKNSKCLNKHLTNAKLTKGKFVNWTKNKVPNWLKNLPKPLKLAGIASVLILGVNHFKRAGRIEKEREIVNQLQSQMQNYYPY